jgi:hypothetical protein
MVLPSTLSSNATKCKEYEKPTTTSHVQDLLVIRLLANRATGFKRVEESEARFVILPSSPASLVSQEATELRAGVLGPLIKDALDETDACDVHKS